MKTLFPGPRTKVAWCVRLRSLARDTRGQDLIEYALLSAVVGLVGLATMNALGITMGSAYVSWTTAVNALWQTPPPPPSP